MAAHPIADDVEPKVLVDEKAVLVVLALHPDVGASGAAKTAQGGLPERGPESTRTPEPRRVVLSLPCAPGAPSDFALARAARARARWRPGRGGLRGAARARGPSRPLRRRGRCCAYARSRPPCRRAGAARRTRRSAADG